MATFQKISWSHESTYYGPVKDGKACGKGVIDFSTAKIKDDSGMFVPKTLRGIFDDKKVTDATYEFERRGDRYAFTGEVENVALVDGKLKLNGDTSWTFTGTFNGTYLTTGKLQHPLICDGRPVLVQDLGVAYYDITPLKRLSELLEKAANGATVTADDTTYTTPDHAVRVCGSSVYDGDYVIEGGGISFSGTAKKIHIEKGFKMEGDFVDGDFQSGTLTINGVSIPISNVTEDGDLIINSELFA